MQYSNKEILMRIEKAKKSQKKLSHLTDKSTLSTEDKFKISLCKHFTQFAISKRMKLKEISKMTKIPITRLSEMANYKIKKFTVDQLLKNLSILATHNPQIREYLVFLGYAAEMPALTVIETKKLTKSLKEVSRTRLKSSFAF